MNWRRRDRTHPPRSDAPQADAPDPATEPGGATKRSTAADGQTPTGVVDGPSDEDRPHAVDPPSPGLTPPGAPTTGSGDPERPPADPAPRPLPSPDLGPIDTPGPAPAPAHEAVVLAVTNQKGGVGKTTTTVSLGAALAAEGLDVLLVDLDPQGNATTGLGLRVTQGSPSSYRVIVERYPLVDAAEPTAVRRLHIVPSSLDLAGAEIELVPQFSRERRLQEALDSVRDQYDVVLVDCPPSLGLLTVNALVAADQVLVPIQCEYYALEGLGQLMRTIEMVRSNLNDDLALGGVLMTMYDARTNLSQQVVDEVRAHFGSVAFSTVIPRTVRLSEAPSYGQPITEFDPSSRGARAYQRLARELARRLGLAADNQDLSPLDALLGTQPAADPDVTGDDARQGPQQAISEDGAGNLAATGETDGRRDPGASPQDDPLVVPADPDAMFHVDPSPSAAPTEEGPTWLR